MAKATCWRNHLCYICSHDWEDRQLQLFWKRK